MAKFGVIADTGMTLVQLLKQGMEGVFPAGISVEVLLETPDKFDGHISPTAKPTVTVFLYRVAIHSEMRNAPRRVLANGTTTRPLLPLELSYLITPWAAQTQTEHLLAGRILQILYDHAELGPNELQGNSWSPEDSVQLLLETLPTNEHYQIWDTTKLPYRLSLTYLARVLGIEPGEAIDSPPVVETIFGSQP
jgi:hypothetical protein